MASPMILMALEYQNSVLNVVKGLAYQKDFRIGSDDCVDLSNISETKRNLCRSLEVICYFKDFIRIKLSRALLGKIEEEEFHLDFFVRDRKAGISDAT